MASAVVAEEVADMDQPGKLPGEAAAGSPAARVGEWQPCVAELDIATVVEVGNSLDRALEERDRTAEGGTRKGRDNEFPFSPQVDERKRPAPPFLGGHIPDNDAARRDKRASDWDRRRVEDIVPDDSDLYRGEEGIGPGDWGLRRDGGTLGCL